MSYLNSLIFEDKEIAFLVTILLSLLIVLCISMFEYRKSNFHG